MNGRCFEDCYWYYEEKDMGARIPFCKLRKGIDPIGLADCENCENYHSKYKPTNADKIRAMSDEKLANFLCRISICTGRTCLGMKYCDFDGTGYLAWLREEVDD